jgi:thioredoxin 1
MIAPILDDVATSYAGKLRVAKINIDHNQKTPRNYNVRGIPTLMIFKDGKCRRRRSAQSARRNSRS